MSSNVIVLCEDQAQYWFTYGYLKKLGYHRRSITQRISPGGSAQQFVKQKYAEEVTAFNSIKNSQKNASLVVMLDADKDKYVNSEMEIVDKLKNELEASLEKNQQRTREDRRAIFVPVRNIESWIFYVEQDYKQVPDYKETYKNKVSLKPAKAAEQLYETLCKSASCPSNMPASLQDACKELERIKLK